MCWWQAINCQPPSYKPVVTLEVNLEYLVVVVCIIAILATCRCCILSSFNHMLYVFIIIKKHVYTCKKRDFKACARSLHPQRNERNERIERIEGQRTLKEMNEMNEMRHYTFKEMKELRVPAPSKKWMKWMKWMKWGTTLSKKWKKWGATLSKKWKKWKNWGPPHFQRNEWRRWVETVNSFCRLTFYLHQQQFRSRQSFASYAVLSSPLRVIAPLCALAVADLVHRGIV